MQYRITIKGVSGLVVNNGAAGLDTRSPANIEKAQIAKKRGSNRTESDEDRLRELECFTSLYLDENESPTLPPAVLRACLEGAARKTREGAAVREGLIVTDVELFDYDRELLGTTAEDVAKNAQFTVGAVVQRSRVLRTRAKFDEWSVVFVIDTDPELVDLEKLTSWLDIAGRRIGVGDWRPQKSGHYGRFQVETIEPLSKPD